MQTLIFEILTRPKPIPDTLTNPVAKVSIAQVLVVNGKGTIVNPYINQVSNIFAFVFATNTAGYWWCGVIQEADNDAAPYYPISGSGTETELDNNAVKIENTPVSSGDIFGVWNASSGLFPFNVRCSVQTPPDFYVYNRGSSSIIASLIRSNGGTVKKVNVKPDEKVRITHTEVDTYTLQISHTNKPLRLTLITPTGALYGNPISTLAVNGTSYTVYTREVSQFPIFGADGLPLYSTTTKKEKGTPVYGGMIRAEKLPPLGAREEMVGFADEPTDPSSASTVYNTTRREVIDRLLAKPWVKDSGFYDITAFSAEVYSGHRYSTGKRYCSGHVGRTWPGTTCGCVVYRLMGKVGQQVSIEINVGFYFRANYLTGPLGNTTYEVVRNPSEFPRALIGVNTDPETDTIKPGAFAGLTSLAPNVDGAVYRYTTVIPQSRIFRFSIMPETWLEFYPRRFPYPLPDPGEDSDVYVSELTVGWQAEIYPYFQNVW